MEEIDNIIIHSLRQIGCDIDENSTLSNLDPATVVKCVSRCLRAIDSSLELPDSMPTGMAQKYGVTIALAEKCTEIGFRGDIGYQTFLYSNNLVELRRVLMFLIDRLPKDEPESNSLTSQELTEREKLDLALRKNLSMSLKMTKTIHPIMDCRRFDYKAVTNFDPKKSIYSQTNPSNLWSTLITNNDSGGKVKPPIRPRSMKSSTGQLRSSASTSSVNVDKSSEVESPESETIPEIPKEDPVEVKRNQIESLRLQIEQKRDETLELKQKIEELKTQSKSGMETLESLKLQKKIKERTLLVLENPDENIQKLQKMIENASDKKKRLQDQWLEHKTPLQSKIDEIEARKLTSASKTKVIEDQIAEARQKQKIIRSETRLKAQQYSQFMDELGKVNQKIDRSAYTSRILEIIGNIRKQKTDIDKILKDTREVQKDINTVTGKLERQFTITDDLLFGHAKRDDLTKKAYKLFLKAHSDSSDLAKSIQDTGKISREIRDLEEQIENSRTRNTSANIAQVSKDLEEMTAENEKLFQEIQKLRR